MKLKALSINYLEQVRLWRNEQQLALRTPFLLTAEQQEGFYWDVICNRQANARYWGIHDDINNFIGMCGLEDIQWENRLAEISLLLDQLRTLNKYGADALSLLLEQGFMYLNLENITAEIYKCNPGFQFWMGQAAKHMAKLAILPNRKYYAGQYYDSLYITFNKGAYLEHENTIIKSA